MRETLELMRRHYAVFLFLSFCAAYLLFVPGTALGANWSGSQDVVNADNPLETRTGYTISGTITFPASVAPFSTYSVTVTHRLDSAASLSCFDQADESDGPGCDSLDVGTTLILNGTSQPSLLPHNNSRTYTFTAGASGSENITLRSVPAVPSGGNMRSTYARFNLPYVINSWSIPINAAPVVNCVGSWSSWGACSISCGGGTQTRTYTITTPRSGGGTACPNNDGDTQTQACNTQACSVPNCSSRTVSWTPTGTTCSGTILATSHNSTRNVNSTNGNTGSATFLCNGNTDTYTYQSGTCVPPAGPPLDMFGQSWFPNNGDRFDVTTGSYTFVGAAGVIGPDISASWTAELQIDLYGDTGSSDIVVPAGTFSGLTAAGQSFNATYNTALPVGRHEFRFKVDSTDAVSESNETNNYSPWRTIEIQPQTPVPTHTCNADGTVSIRWVPTTGATAYSLTFDRLSNNGNNASCPPAGLQGNWYCPGTEELFEWDPPNPRRTNVLLPGETYTTGLMSYNGVNGGVWSATRNYETFTCSNIPDLQSQNLAASAGPYVQNTPLTLTASVRNNGFGGTGATFTDEFTYQWGGTGGSWQSFTGNTVSKSPLAAGASSADGPVSFTPNRSGDLYIQHCVDSTLTIPEGAGETPNCTTIGPLSVSPAEPGGMTQSCNAAGTQATLSWNAVSNISHYLVRVDDTTVLCGSSVSGPPTFYCHPTGVDYTNDYYTNTSIVMNVTPGISYEWWIRSVNALGVMSTATRRPFTCAAPALPDLTAVNTAPAAGVSLNNPASITFTGTLTNSNAVTAAMQNVWADVEIDWNQANCAAAAPDQSFNAGGPWVSLGVGATQPMSATLTAANSQLQNGTHCYRMIVDRGGLVTESNDLNNGGNPWRSFTVSNLPQCSDGIDNVDPEDVLADYSTDPGCVNDIDDDETDVAVLPDLSAVNVAPIANSVSSPVGNLTFTGTAVNSAVAPVPQGGWADVEIDWNSDGSFTNYNAFGGVPLGAFAQGASKNLTYTHNNPPVGTHRYRFNVDVTDILRPESNDMNNRSGWTSFIVGGNQPSVITDPANPVTANSFVLNGRVNPNNSASTGWFRYWSANPGSCNDTSGTRVPNAGGVNLGSGSALVPMSQSVGGRTPNTTYYFCAIASNANGTEYGSIRSVTTSSPPPVVTADIWACNLGGAGCIPKGGNKSINVGDQIEIQWDSNGTGCLGSNFSTGSGNPRSGTQSNVTEPTAGNYIDYTVLCDGTANAEVRVTTGASNPTIIHRPPIVNPGTSVEVEYDTGAVAPPTCNIRKNGSPWQGPLTSWTGIFNETINARTIFVIDCGAGGSDTTVVSITPLEHEE